MTVASASPKKVCKLSRGMRVQADIHLDEVTSNQVYDVIVLPGGMPGATHFAENSHLINLLKQQKSCGRWYAAICASPAVVFKGKGIATTEAMVCYDHKDFTDMLGEKQPSDRVVVSGKCITSVAPGSAIDFGLAIVECLVGKAKADHVAKEMMMLSRSLPVHH